MIILFRSEEKNKGFRPVVVIDYTRSDDQYTLTEIKNFSKQFAKRLSLGAKILEPSIYSLDYSFTYTHTGINYGDSLKTKFTGFIKNPPMELVGLLNIRQYTSQQNLDALKRLINSVIDPQIAFPTGGFVIRDSDGKFITRTFIIYSTPIEADSRRINTSLILKGAAFDAMVVRLKFAVNLTKDKPLFEQLLPILKGYLINPSFPTGFNLPPVVAKYYAPAPIEDVLTEICFDNNLAYELDDLNFIRFYSLSPDNPPKIPAQNFFSFMNRVPGTKMIGPFNLQNYTSAQFEAEVTDVQLFRSVGVYDDTLTPSIFANLQKINGSLKNGFNAYRFYTLVYTLTDSREKKSVMIDGTNNWLLFVARIDNILENAIYKNQLGGI